MIKLLSNLINVLIFGGRKTPRDCDKIAMDSWLASIDEKLVDRIRRQIAYFDLFQTSPDGRKTACYCRRFEKPGWPTHILLSDRRELVVARTRFRDVNNPSSQFIAEIYFVGGRLFSVEWNENPDHLSFNDLVLEQVEMSSPEFS